MNAHIHAIISGKVQGVYFRASTQQKAKQLNITGHAKNLSDGTVEVIAIGERNNIQKLLSWLHQGPSLAKVDHVNWTYCKNTDIKPRAFIIL